MKVKNERDIENVPSAWISVKDRLPEIGIEVLVFTYATQTRVWTIADCEVWEDEYGYLHDFEAATHWMPLPDAPEAEA